MNFDAAFGVVVGIEGGLSLVRGDRGNWTSGVVGVGELRGTKYGISAMAYPHEDIASLTLDKAKGFYKRDYWDKVSGDNLPPAVALGMFDAAVNEGVQESIRLTQHALGLSVDGVLGPVTLAAIQTADIKHFARQFAIKRIVQYATLAYWPQDHDGWTGRVIDVYTHMIM